MTEQPRANHNEEGEEPLFKAPGGLPGPDQGWEEIPPEVERERAAPPLPWDEREKGRFGPTPSVFWPILLIGAGILVLLANLGLLPPGSWNLLLRLWPVLLIAIGIEVLVGRRSTAGAIISGILILALLGSVILLVLLAPRIPALDAWTQPEEWRVEQVAYPLSGVERASLYIDWTSVPLELDVLRDSANLIEGNLAVRGGLVFDANAQGGRADIRLDTEARGLTFGLPSLGREDRRWDVRLSPRVPFELAFDGGSGRAQLDLTGLQVAGLRMDVGSGAVELRLPATSSFVGEIEGGSGALDIVLPPDVGARIDLESGSGAFRPSERFRLVEGERNDDGVWETGNWNNADYRIDLRIDQSSGRMTIR